jgi:predicted NodU family carbamoyl transferase
MNPRLFRLLEEFKRGRGAPVLLNMPLDDFDEPIASTPRNALK